MASTAMPSSPLIFTSKAVFEFSTNERAKDQEEGRRFEDEEETRVVAQFDEYANR